MPPKRKAVALLEAAAAAGAASSSVCVQDDGESKEGCIIEERKEEPERKKPYRTCQYGDCTTQATFGFADGKRIRCGPHRLTGMENLSSKKCQFSGCTTTASYGFVGEKSTYCGPHRLPGMDCLKVKKCEAEGCGVIPNYGFKLREPTHCYDHKLEEQFDVTHKKCAEPGCIKRPTFGWKGEKALFCKEHHVEGMVDVENKKCLHPDCDTLANYGFKGQKPLWCATHATKEMSSLRKEKLCMEENCITTATFGFTKKEPTHCKDHKESEMENVMDKRCQGLLCKKVKPPYGNHLTGRAYCATCCDKKQHWKLKTCSQKKCKKIATHSETGCLPFVFCENHMPCGYQSFLEKRCRGCNLPYICDKNGLCLFSCTPNKKFEKVSENLMKDLFQKKGLCFEHNIMSAGSSCSLKKPDFLFRTLAGILIVENDEHQHQSESREDENKRMEELHQALGEAVHFIRFNPDLYRASTDRKRSNKVHLDRRHEQLFDVLQNILEDPLNFFTRFPGLSVSYMYYDDYDTPEKWQPIEVAYTE